MRASSTNVLLDGSANNDEFTGSKGQDVPLDSVQEFSVVTSNFSAQYGRASGGVVNVATMSGTNSFRGTAYEFYRSDKLSANTFDNNANEIEKGEFTRHQLGFSIGGPVKRDKVHFFTNLEHIRVRSADTLITWVPTPEFLAASAGRDARFFSPYGAGATINGPILTRGDVTGYRRCQAPAPSARCRRICRYSAGSRNRCRSMPAAAIRKTNSGSRGSTSA